MMTGRPGVFAGGDMAPSERTVTVAVGHGKKAARHIDACLRGDAYAPPRQTRRSPSFERLNTWYYEDAPATVRPMLEAARRIDNFDEVAGRPRRDQRALRGAPLPLLRQLLRMRQLLRRLPRQRGDQARARQAVRVRLRLLQGLRPLRRGMPVRGDRHGGGGDLRGIPPFSPEREKDAPTSPAFLPEIADRAAHREQLVVVGLRHVDAGSLVQSDDQIVEVHRIEIERLAHVLVVAQRSKDRLRARSRRSVRRSAP